jgi:PEP-CTERM motif
MRKLSVLFLSSFLLFVAVMGAPKAYASEITVTGMVTQSTSDGTGPAVNNPSLNSIADGQTYTLSLDFAGSITGPGTYDLTGGSLVFSDLAAAASESSFSSISLTVSPAGSSDDISLFGCLSTGSGCLVGNSLSLNFAIPSGDLNSLLGAPATTIFGLSPPLDLLQDDGTTDIQGNVTTYSYIATTPEPASLALYGSGLIALALARRKRQRKSPSSQNRTTTVQK